MEVEEARKSAKPIRRQDTTIVAHRTEVSCSAATEAGPSRNSVGKQCGSLDQYPDPGEQGGAYWSEGMGKIRIQAVIF